MATDFNKIKDQLIQKKFSWFQADEIIKAYQSWWVDAWKKKVQEFQKAGWWWAAGNTATSNVTTNNTAITPGKTNVPSIQVWAKATTPASTSSITWVTPVKSTATSELTEENKKLLKSIDYNTLTSDQKKLLIAAAKSNPTDKNAQAAAVLKAYGNFPVKSSAPSEQTKTQNTSAFDYDSLRNKAKAWWTTALNEKERATLIALWFEKWMKDPFGKAKAELDAYKQKLWEASWNIGTFEPDAFSKDAANWIFIKPEFKRENFDTTWESTTVSNISENLKWSWFESNTLNTINSITQAIKDEYAEKAKWIEEYNAKVNSYWEEFDNDLKTKYEWLKTWIENTEAELKTQYDKIKQYTEDAFNTWLEKLAKQKNESKIRSMNSLSARWLNWDLLANAMAEIDNDSNWTKISEDLKTSYVNNLSKAVTDYSNWMNTITSQKTGITDKEKELLSTISQRKSDLEKTLNDVKQEWITQIYKPTIDTLNAKLEKVSANEMSQQDRQDTINRFKNADISEKKTILFNELFKVDSTWSFRQMLTNDMITQALKEPDFQSAVVKLISLTQDAVTKQNLQEIAAKLWTPVWWTSGWTKASWTRGSAWAKASRWWISNDWFTLSADKKWWLKKNSDWTFTVKDMWWGKQTGFKTQQEAEDFLAKQIKDSTTTTIPAKTTPSKNSNPWLFDSIMDISEEMWKDIGSTLSNVFSWTGIEDTLALYYRLEEKMKKLWRPKNKIDSTLQYLREQRATNSRLKSVIKNMWRPAKSITTNPNWSAWAWD